MRMHNPAHPGRLIAEYMEKRSVTEVAKHIGVTRVALSRVLNGKAAVSAEMALRLSAAFGVDADLLLRLQVKRDLWVASQKKLPKISRMEMSTAA
jgi:addiction module HigA family antidote